MKRAENRKSRANDELAEKLGPMERANRNRLSEGDDQGVPNHHILAQTLRFVRGGRLTFVGLIQRAARNGDADARSWWTVFSDLLPSNQLHVDLDAVCEAAGVTPDKIMAVAVSTQMRLGMDAGDLVAATMHPSIVHQTAKSAMRIAGEHADIAQRDREMLFQHHKFIPVPKGVSFSVNASAQAAAAAASAPSVPSFAASLDSATGAHQDIQKRLSAVDAEPAQD